MAYDMLSGDNVSKTLIWFYDSFASKWKSNNFSVLRIKLLKNRFSHFGVNTWFFNDCKFLDIGRISIGDNTSLTNSNIFDGRGGLEIGDDCMIGFQSVILSKTHRSDRKDVPISLQGMYQKKVKIENGVWVGCKVVILPGVTIGARSIVAAGSVVVKDVPPDVVVGGVPAKILSKRR